MNWKKASLVIRDVNNYTEKMVIAPFIHVSSCIKDFSTCWVVLWMDMLFMRSVVDYVNI